MSKYTYLAILVIIAIAMIYPIALLNSEHQQEITIDEKWSKYHGGGAKYLVSTTDGDVYSMEDSTWFLTWDASDRYASIEEGETYTCTVIGWRVPILSWYQNLIAIEDEL